MAREGASPGKLEIEFAIEDSNSYILFVPGSNGRTLMTAWIHRAIVTNHDDAETTITKTWIEIPGVAMAHVPVPGREVRLVGDIDAKEVKIASRKRASIYVCCAASFDGRIAYRSADNKCLLCLSAIGLGVYCTLVPASVLVPREDR